MVIGLAQTGIETDSTFAKADALFTRSLNGCKRTNCVNSTDA